MDRGDRGRHAELLLPEEEVGAVGVAGVGGAEGGLPGCEVVSIDVLVFVEVGGQECAIDHVDDEFADDGVGERFAGGKFAVDAMLSRR